MAHNNKKMNIDIDTPRDMSVIPVLENCQHTQVSLLFPMLRGWKSKTTILLGPTK